MKPSRRRARDLPLFAKLLVPFLLLILVIAAGGLYLVVHDLSSTAQGTLNSELLRRSLDARSRIHDRELYLLESVSFAANLEGMAAAMRTGDRRTVAGLLRSVPALKTELELVAMVQGRRTLAGFTRQEPEARPRPAAQGGWGSKGFVRQALAGTEKSAGFPELYGAPMMAIAAPVCSGVESCQPVGVAVVGMRLESLAMEAAGNARRPDVAHPQVAVYSDQGRLLAASEARQARPTWQPVQGNELVRQTETHGGTELGVLYAPLEVGGRRVGTIAVSLPTAPAFAAARDTAFRLGLLLFLAIVGVVTIGAVVSRWLLRQVNRLVETSRELGQGNLTARAPVVARDELGELAEVLNDMAGQLQSSHGTLERRVEERTAEVQRLLQERNELFAGISHELRTPIAIILSEARMLLDPTFTSHHQSAGDAANTIIVSGEQLLSRVNEILELARAESGRLEVDLAEVRLPEVFGDLRPTAEALAAANGLGLDIRAPSSLPSIRADRARLKDVLVNLIENAAKYTPTGGNVSLAARRRNGSVRMTVTDTGLGIPDDVGDRVFEPFFQVPGTKPPRGESSSGLGLALAKRLVEAQGGSISYTSDPGKGTQFVVELPVTKPGGGSQTERRKAITARTRR